MHKKSFTFCGFSPPWCTVFFSLTHLISKNVSWHHTDSYFVTCRLETGQWLTGVRNSSHEHRLWQYCVSLAMYVSIGVIFLFLFLDAVMVCPVISAVCASVVDLSHFIYQSSTIGILTASTFILLYVGFKQCLVKILTEAYSFHKALKGIYQITDVYVNRWRCS